MNKIYQTLHSLFQGSEEALDVILWTGTCFPAGSEDEICQQLWDSYHKYGAHISDVIQFQDAEFNQQFKEYRQSQSCSTINHPF